MSVTVHLRRGAAAVGGAALLAAAALLWQPAFTAAFSLNFSNFRSTAGLKLNGDAHREGKRLRLTDADFGEAGSAFTKRKAIDTRESFETRFRFHLHDGSADPADGIVFVLQPGSRRTLGGAGGGIGYAGIDPSLGVEFDIWFNLGSDPDGNHVGILRDGDTSDHLRTGTPVFSLEDLRLWAWVDYLAGKKTLKVYVSKTKTKPDDPLVKLKRNLKNILGENVRAGFTGATGGDFAEQDILKWKLSQRD